jgi:hypothetical protein
MNVIQFVPKLTGPIHSLYLDIQGRFNQAQRAFCYAEGLAEGFGIALGPQKVIADAQRDQIEARATALFALSQAAEKLCAEMEETLTFRQMDFLAAGSTYQQRQVQLIDGQKLAVDAQEILTGILADISELKTGQPALANPRLALESRSLRLQERMRDLLLKMAA